ncbi:MAG TPA: hypothetical protein ENI61_00465 [Ignavibacteria bacterium]|nr:hypothetical protein [Ignavibacteria bacterium]
MTNYIFRKEIPFNSHNLLVDVYAKINAYFESGSMIINLCVKHKLNGNIIIRNNSTIASYENNSWNFFSLDPDSPEKLMSRKVISEIYGSEIYKFKYIENDHFWASVINDIEKLWVVSNIMYS